eukprot:9298895-Alexandrium_andersonii.AAC.1
MLPRRARSAARAQPGTSSRPRLQSAPGSRPPVAADAAAAAVVWPAEVAVGATTAPGHCRCCSCSCCHGSRRRAFRLT